MADDKSSVNILSLIGMFVYLSEILLNICTLIYFDVISNNHAKRYIENVAVETDQIFSVQ